MAWGIIGLLSGVIIGLNGRNLWRLWRKPVAPGKLTATNQGKEDAFAVAVGIRFIEKRDATTGAKSVDPVICEWTTKKPLVYVDNEATQFIVAQPEPGRFVLMIGLENVPVELA